MPKIHEAALKGLRPTQLTVGMIEVADKKKHLEALNPADRQDFMQAHPIPAVTGPGGKLYITDHHHLGRAALEAGLTTAFFETCADLSRCADAKFWDEMNDHLWVHPLDANGVRRRYSTIPASLVKLVDDPYRSLAGYVRNAGGYEKTPTAFAEFVWADFFRRSIAIEDLKANFQGAVKIALPLAKSHLAKGLPGARR
jgi:hypothetical protein